MLVILLSMISCSNHVGKKIKQFYFPLNVPIEHSIGIPIRCDKQNMIRFFSQQGDTTIIDLFKQEQYAQDPDIPVEYIDNKYYYKYIKYGECRFNHFHKDSMSLSCNTDTIKITGNYSVDGIEFKDPRPSTETFSASRTIGDIEIIKGSLGYTFYYLPTREGIWRIGTQIKKYQIKKSNNPDLHSHVRKNN
ncbi:MAG: hypothetical protein MK212_18720 [Saprospiraceae bacterium]|nr:hypothetical protein [Saprospiraceae bacterium]